MSIRETNEPVGMEAHCMAVTCLLETGKDADVGRALDVCESCPKLVAWKLEQITKMIEQSPEAVKDNLSQQVLDPRGVVVDRVTSAMNELTVAFMEYSSVGFMAERQMSCLLSDVPSMDGHEIVHRLTQTRNEIRTMLQVAGYRGDFQYP